MTVSCSVEISWATACHDNYCFWPREVSRLQAEGASDGVRAGSGIVVGFPASSLKVSGRLLSQKELLRLFFWALPASVCRALGGGKQQFQFQWFRVSKMRENKKPLSGESQSGIRGNRKNSGCSPVLQKHSKTLRTKSQYAHTVTEAMFFFFL